MQGLVAPDEASSLGTGGPKRRRSPCCRAAVSLVWPGWRSHCTWGCFRPLWWLVCWGGYRPWLRLRFLPVPAFLGFKEWCVPASEFVWWGSPPTLHVIRCMAMARSTASGHARTSSRRGGVVAPDEAPLRGGVRPKRRLHTYLPVPLWGTTREDQGRCACAGLW